MNEAVIELIDAGLAYSNGDEVLSGLNVRIRPGERVVVLGANGCGKSSLLKLLNGLHVTTRGEMRFAGDVVDARRLRDRTWCRDFRRRVVLMFQHPEAMLFNPTVAEEIAYGLRHLPAVVRQAAVAHWADVMGLARRLDAPPFELSGGEKQRLCLACLLAMSPEVLLLDEPTANLDPHTVGWFLDWLAEREITTVIATHHLALAPELGTRTIIIGENHRIAFDGRTQEALADSALLLANNLAHRHVHRHGDVEHRHVHTHPVWGD